jgi:cellulose synthase/poly-beta-1,6-N-acetylglucosamine synthase-like glycosyltransferase
LLGYVYVGYPALMWTWATLAGRRPSRARSAAGAAPAPDVTVLVVAHDEAAQVAGRLENLLAADYPRDRLDIVLASDGSGDATVEIARAYEPAGVTVAAFGTRRGKPAVLNDLVPKSRGAIVVLGDARQRFAPDVIRTLCCAFEDPSVGAVSGELVLTAGATGAVAESGVGAYWRYEKFIRKHESRVASTVGATGAVYAIRRDLFEPVPEDTILDDVLIPLRIVRRGYRVLFEPAARATDQLATSGQEFARKVRTIAGNFQLFSREGWLLDPRRNRLWLQTVSHKALRLLAPVLHVTALGANVALAGAAPYRVLLLGHLAFYAAALGGCALRSGRRRIPLLALPYALCLLNWATVVGFVRFATGRQRVTWDRAPAKTGGRRVTA